MADHLEAGQHECARPAPCFWLGTHNAIDLELSPVPLFLSYHRLPVRRFPRAIVPWEQDARTYWLLSHLGHHELSAKAYADVTVRHAQEVGNLIVAWIQDWTCDPESLRRSGRSIKHQFSTIWFIYDEPGEPGSIVLANIVPIGGEEDEAQGVYITLDADGQRHLAGLLQKMLAGRRGHIHGRYGAVVEDAARGMSETYEVVGDVIGQHDTGLVVLKVHGEAEPGEGGVEPHFHMVMIGRPFGYSRVSSRSGLI